MTVFLVFVVALCFCLGVLAQYRYAQKGCPNSWRWKGLLFITGALAVYAFIELLSTFGAGNETTQDSDYLIRLLVSLLFGIGFAWLLPYKIRRAIPKR